MFETIKCEVGAIFQLHKYKSDGSLVESTEPFHNLVLDAGLARMGVEQWINRCMVGTGSSEPHVGQTQLDSFLGSTSNYVGESSSNNTTVKPYYMGVRITFRFATGTIVGNLTEIGLGWSDTACWNRTLIKDATGQPTVLTILDDEYLDVSAEIRMHPTPNAIGSFQFKDKLGVVKSTHTYSGYPIIGSSGAYFNKWHLSESNYFQDSVVNDSPTPYPSGTQIGATSHTSRTLVSSSKVTYKASLNLTTGNGRTSAIVVFMDGVLGSNTAHGYKFAIDPPIEKSGVQEMVYTYSIEWGRHTEA